MLTSASFVLSSISNVSTSIAERRSSPASSAIMSLALIDKESDDDDDDDDDGDGGETEESVELDVVDVDCG